MLISTTVLLQDRRVTSCAVKHDQIGDTLYHRSVAVLTKIWHIGVLFYGSSASERLFRLLNEGPDEPNQVVSSHDSRKSVAGPPKVGWVTYPNHPVYNT